MVSCRETEVSAVIQNSDRIDAWDYDHRIFPRVKIGSNVTNAPAVLMDRMYQQGRAHWPLGMVEWEQRGYNGLRWRRPFHKSICHLVVPNNRVLYHHRQAEGHCATAHQKRQPNSEESVGEVPGWSGQDHLYPTVCLCHCSDEVKVRSENGGIGGPAVTAFAVPRLTREIAPEPSSDTDGNESPTGLLQVSPR
jgi:hypothetical protein